MYEISPGALYGLTVEDMGVLKEIKRGGPLK